MSEKHARERFMLTKEQFDGYLEGYRVLNAVRWVEVCVEKDAIALWQQIQKEEPSVILEAVIERIRNSNTLYTLLIDLWILSGNKNIIKTLGHWMLKKVK